MDRGLCAGTLIGRCSVLVAYHHRRAGGISGPGREELRLELVWLAADARRWGVRPEVVAAGVLAELRRDHAAGVASALLEDVEAAFELSRCRA
jgi:hypothetical protein